MASRTLLSRLGGRIVTGPLAFLLCGVLDVCAALVLLRRSRKGRGSSR